jgi:transcriptional regulator with XRE-family HTH domain
VKGFDGEGFYAALDRARRARDLSWRQVASEAGVSPSTLTRLGNGLRPDIDSFAKLVQWLNCSADPFLGVAPAPVPEGEDLVRTLMGLGLDTETAEAFGRVISLLRPHPRDGDHEQ